MQGICLRVASRASSTLVSSTRRLPRLLLVFCVTVFSYLETLCHVVTFLVTVETSDINQILASRTGNVGGIDTGVWGGVFPSLLVN